MMYSRKRHAPDDLYNSRSKRCRLFGSYTPVTEDGNSDLSVGSSTPEMLPKYTQSTPLDLLAVRFARLEITDEDRFTFFPQLPTELRLKIWPLLFPESRHVSIDFGCICQQACVIGMLCPQGGFEHKIDLPITLSINCESRYETLCHYTMIYPNNYPTPFHTRIQTPCLGRPLCFNPAIDTAYFSMGQFGFLRYEFRYWIQYLASYPSNMLKKLRSLEIRGLALRTDANKTPLEFFKETFRDATEFEDWKGLLNFDGLETLCFTYRCPHSNMLNPRYRFYLHQECLKRERVFQNGIGQWYQKHNSRMTKRKAPEIMFRIWAEAGESPFKKIEK